MRDAIEDALGASTLPRAWQGWLVDACVLASDAPKCRLLRSVLEPCASAHGVGGHVPITYEGPVSRSLGLLDSALGDHDSAERRLRAALAQMRTHGLRAWVAQLCYDLGRALLRAGRPADARTPFAEAAELAEQLGMRGLHERAQRQSRTAPEQPSVAERRPATSLQDTRVAGLDAPDARALRDYQQRLGELATALLGLSPDAAALAGFLGYASAVVQHMNLRTPLWIGRIVTRPEAHGLHQAGGIHAYNYASFPIWDIVFGTFRHVDGFPEQYGFWSGASSMLGSMLIGRDVGKADET